MLVAAIALMLGGMQPAVKQQSAKRSSLASVVMSTAVDWPQPRRCHSYIPERLIPWHNSKFPLLSYGYRSDGDTAPSEAHKQEGNTINHPEPMTTMRNLQDAAAAAGEPKAMCLTSAKTHGTSPSTGFIRGPCHSNSCILSGQYSDSSMREGGRCSDSNPAYVEDRPRPPFAGLVEQPRYSCVHSTLVCPPAWLQPGFAR